MSKDDQSTFTLPDVRLIRYLVFALGAVGIGMLLVTDRESPLMVVGFVTIVTGVPIAVIYFLRRRARNKAAHNVAPKPDAAQSGE